MKRIVAIIFSIIIALLAGASIAISLTKSNTPYSIYNDDAHGYSAIASMSSKIVWSPYLDKLDPSNHLLLVAMVRPPDGNVLSALREWIEKGGMVIILDEHGYANDLLEPLGVHISNISVYDVLSNDGSRIDPVATVKLNNRSLRLVFHGVALLYIRLPVDPRISVRVVARTSPMSYVDVDSDGYYSFDDRIGSFPLVAVIRYNDSTIVVIPDLDVFANKYIKMYDNELFLREVAVGKKLVLYAPTLIVGPNDKLKYKYYLLLQDIGLNPTDLAVYALIVLAVTVVSRYEPW